MSDLMELIGKNIITGKEVTFECGMGGYLQGELVQFVQNYDELVVPETVVNEGYKFLQWCPEIPTSGKVDMGRIDKYYAKFEYVSTMEEIREEKIRNLSAACKQYITDGMGIKINEKNEHFSYGEEDQLNLKEILDFAMSTKTSAYYHPDGESDKLYSLEEIVFIYYQLTMHKFHHKTYFNQLRELINSLNSKEDILSVEYGQDLTDGYLESYSESMEQFKQMIMDFVLNNSGIDLSAESFDKNLY